MSKINLGDTVKDKVTGLQGIAISRIEYMNGCIQFGVKARVKEAALKEAEYIDEDQLEWIDAGINKPVKKKVAPASRRPSGGDQPDQPRKSYYQARKRN